MPTRSPSVNGLKEQVVLKDTRRFLLYLDMLNKSFINMLFFKLQPGEWEPVVTELQLMALGICQHSITMSVRKGTPLIRYMEMASRVNSVEFSG